MLVSNLRIGKGNQNLVKIKFYSSKYINKKIVRISIKKNLIKVMPNFNYNFKKNYLNQV